MKTPRLLTSVADDFLAGQLAQIAHESRWVIGPLPANPPPTVAPAVAVLGVAPGDPLEALSTLAALAQNCPDVPVAVLTLTKITEADRARWLALVLDLGARAVLFPPYTRLVLDDLLGGLMAATARRLDLADDRPHRTPEPDPEPAIDLASGDYEEPA